MMLELPTPSNGENRADPNLTAHARQVESADSDARMLRVSQRCVMDTFCVSSCLIDATGSFPLGDDIEDSRTPLTCGDCHNRWIVFAIGTGEQPVPLGGESWKTTRVLLPETLRNRTFRNVFTGAEIRPTLAADSGWIFVGEAFEKLPVAMLRAVV